jgi:hypothetical protein
LRTKGRISGNTFPSIRNYVTDVIISGGISHVPAFRKSSHALNEMNLPIDNPSNRKKFTIRAYTLIGQVERDEEKRYTGITPIIEFC